MNNLVNMSFSDNNIIDKCNHNWSSYNLDLSNSSLIKNHRSCKFDGISERCIETQDLIKIDENKDFIIAFWYKDNSNFTKLTMNVLSEKCINITDKSAPMNPCIVFENGKLICQDDDNYMLNYVLENKDNEWHHYCIMRISEDDTNHIKLYIDGKLKVNNNCSNKSLSFLNMIIGDNINDGSYKLNGNIDDLFISTIDEGDYIPNMSDYEWIKESDSMITFDDYIYSCENFIL